ncbi:DUF523 domain-containing protein [Roseicyclus persicicus]|uniref:DUF523 domain-containing protein n=1 Tax=Roseicyclus persicicus TaxID=2650661 RepID=A0A7X6GZT4_9RHOB|nr:DUF523 domain-containing protein [Roseibacterium persicicum]NKX45363.1 DUF523 domain-containing protein [Roseibacterium persicicum]
MERILVSACLMGATVRYDGRAKDPGTALVARWQAEGRLVALCPELAGGLPVPRLPAEIEAGATGADVAAGRARIVDRAGADVTGAFLDGAQAALRLARDAGLRFALLTEGSPSCGVRRIHAGRFDGTTRPGEGVVAATLRAAGIAVYSHEEAAALAAALDAAEKPRG